MQLGTLLPLGDIGGDPAVVREYAQTAENIGYDFVEAPDHVLGASEASAAEAGRTGAGLYHDPFVLFGFLAGCTSKLGFSTGVLILPQRQTVLVAKQAASLDVLCGGRFRLGIGVGWNEVSSPVSTRTSITAAAAPRSRCRSYRSCGASRMSASRAAGIRSRTPGSTRGRPRARCPCGTAGITSAPCRASPNGATAGCRTPIHPIRLPSMSLVSCVA